MTEIIDGVVWEHVKVENSISYKTLRLPKGTLDIEVDNKLKSLEKDCDILLEAYGIDFLRVKDNIDIVSSFNNLKIDMLEYNIQLYIIKSGGMTFKSVDSNKVYGLSLYDKFIERIKLLLKQIEMSEVDEDGNSIYGDSIFGVSSSNTLVGFKRFGKFGRYWR